MNIKKLKRGFKKDFNIWALLSTLGVVLILAPTLDVLLKIFEEPNENWYHVKEFLLKDYTINSLKIAFFTAIFTLILGVVLAWLISMYDFPFRKFFSLSLVLPIAIPGYIAAYTYAGIFSYTGIIQKTLRNNFSIFLDPKYFDIMSLKGAVFIFTFFLFPYVYITTKAFLENQSSALIENARMLGHNSFSIFTKIILPISRPSIIAGVSLVILEVFSDYGVVNYFGVSTFSTAIFKTWYGMGDIDTAVKLSGILMIFVVAIFIFENILRGRRKYSSSNSKVRPLKRQKLSGKKALIAFLSCFIVFLISFLIPVLQLISWAIFSYKNVLNHDFLKLLRNTILVASIATLIIIIVSIIIGNFCRINKSKISKIFSKIATLGYSIPGAIIAISVIVFFISIDRSLVDIYIIFGVTSKTLILSSSLTMLIFAYIIRFLAVGFNNVQAGFEKVGFKYFEASRLLGYGITETFLKVDLNMIKGAIVSGGILTFIDIIKELPLTMTLRPFNFDTLATKAYEFANDERVYEAAIPSLIIIGISMISIFIFHNISKNRREKSAS
ncbi:ABC transporter permease [Clostridium septicum]|uniref:Iron ABC transporter n=2 Tax=Clostridium TaxID=1485 RepID=A0A9N7JJ83_CLOSE|nr:iron ABC transporter permease [Clostridium septicum]AYE33020.1 iron ABC transporter [Clostridium septicum]MDU1313413.1 iron ABC transporter permease [Clostridium septicum]QAS61189.1 iron ABC transporter permease [Clostridium septicum]UEC19463.1 iron ABC transporter permease [Clostridium septicum]USR99584.1 iron ABC transporter permease [Clostridium septicum]